MPMNARRFFETALPQMVEQSFGEFLLQQGTISFDVETQGQWSFTFGSEEPVQPGLAKNADLALWFKPAAFASFVDGTLDAIAAVKAKEITVKGREFMLLEQFGRLLAPPSKDLGWDIQTVG